MSFIKNNLLLLAILSLWMNVCTAGTIRYLHTDILGSVIAETDESGNVISRSHYEPFGLRTGGEKAGIGYTGHLQDEELSLTYMQQRYYDPVIGRFYSNDPIGSSASNPMMFNRYAYAYSNPYRYIDPDGMYGRGVGWTDEQWNQFNQAQQSAAESMSKVSSELKDVASNMKDGDVTKDGYSGADLTKMAGSLDAGVKALQDNGRGGYLADAKSMEGSVAGTGEIGGKKITMNVGHPNFGDNQSTRFIVGHESLHNAGLSHPKYMGFTPYRYGGFGERQSFKNLPGHKRSANPDHVMSVVYPND